MPSTTDSRLYDKLVASHPKAKKVLAEGDSWLAYPPQFIGFGAPGNIVDCLSRRDDLVIYSTAKNGDEAVTMLSGKEKFDLLKRLRYNAFDYLLFSGGGNDIVGRYDFDFLIKKWSDGLSWNDCIDKGRLAIKLAQLKSAYQVLCELVYEYSLNKQIKIITHTYDLAIPKNVGFELFDVIPLGKAWMHPYLDAKDIKVEADQIAIVKYVMEQFRGMLLSVQRDYSQILTVVDTQGTVEKSEWLNEIHPTPKGFKKVADKIYAQAMS